MKTRNGFVSNSSASSFIVRDIDNFVQCSKNKPRKGKLDKKTIDKLLKYGFKETYLSHPSHLDHTDPKDNSIWNPWKDLKTGKIIVRNFGYNVSCNEWDVIQFLVKNDIGFVATGHYGHLTYLFHRGDKHLMVFRNYGMEVETYYKDDSWNQIMREWRLGNGRDEKPYERIPIAKVLRE